MDKNMNKEVRDKTVISCEVGVNVRTMAIPYE